MIQGLDNTSRSSPPGARFPLGRLLITPAAKELLGEHGLNPSRLLDRHAAGDWGDVDAEDSGLNDQSLLDGSRVLSSYRVMGTTEKVWVITEADRSATTILLPDDY